MCIIMYSILLTNMLTTYPVYIVNALATMTIIHFGTFIPLVITTYIKGAIT